MSVPESVSVVGGPEALPSGLNWATLTVPFHVAVTEPPLVSLNVSVAMRYTRREIFSIASESLR